MKNKTTHLRLPAVLLAVMALIVTFIAAIVTAIWIARSLT